MTELIVWRDVKDAYVFASKGNKNAVFGGIKELRLNIRPDYWQSCRRETHVLFNSYTESEIAPPPIGRPIPSGGNGVG